MHIPGYLLTDPVHSPETPPPVLLHGILLLSGFLPDTGVSVPLHNNPVLIQSYFLHSSAQKTVTYSPHPYLSVALLLLWLHILQPVG